MADALEREAKLAALSFMQKTGGRAELLKEGTYRNNKGKARELDVVVFTEQCVLVVEVR